MLYWVGLVSVVFILAILVSYFKISRRIRTQIFSLISILLIWFSGFRDGLGTDYEVYVHRLLHAPIIDLPFFFSEPLYNLFVNLIRSTALSEVFFFLVMAVITVMPVISTYKKFNHFFICIAIYMMLPILYFGSFNVVRQLAAASIFLYASKYIIDRRFEMYVLFMVVAFFLHKSALVLLPIYFINFKNIRISEVLALLFFSFSPGIFSNLITKVTPYLEIISYDMYLDYASESFSSISFTQILFHIIIIILVFVKDKIKGLFHGNYYIFTLKMGVLYLFFTNLALSGVSISYRLAFYFAPFLPLLACMIVDNVRYNFKLGVTLVLFVLFAVVGVRFLYLNADNRLVVPNDVKPIISLFD